MPATISSPAATISSPLEVLTAVLQPASIDRTTATEIARVVRFFMMFVSLICLTASPFASGSFEGTSPPWEFPEWRLRVGSESWKLAWVSSMSCVCAAAHHLRGICRENRAGCTNLINFMGTAQCFPSLVTHDVSTRSRR